MGALAAAAACALVLGGCKNMRSLNEYFLDFGYADIGTAGRAGDVLVVMDAGILTQVYAAGGLGSVSAATVISIVKVSFGNNVSEVIGSFTVPSDLAAIRGQLLTLTVAGGKTLNLGIGDTVYLNSAGTASSPALTAFSGVIKR